MRKPFVFIIALCLFLTGGHPALAKAAAFSDASEHSVEEDLIDCERNALEYPYVSEVFSDFTRNENALTLKELSFSFLELPEIPGLPQHLVRDRQEGRIPDTALIPQGICIAGDYLLTTSYSEDDEKSGCLFVFDRETKEFLTALGMPKGSHLGGIAFDGENIWICHSHNKTLLTLSYKYLDAAGKAATGTFLDISEHIRSYQISNTPSCLTFHDGRLYAATMTMVFLGVMAGYRFDGTALVEEIRYRIPPKVQGVCFDEEGRIYLSTSYGRRSSSYLMRYANLTELNHNPLSPELKVELPPCSEELIYEDNALTILFESAAPKYFYGTDGFAPAISPLDQLLRISLPEEERSTGSGGA